MCLRIFDSSNTENMYRERNDVNEQQPQAQQDIPTVKLFGVPVSKLDMTDSVRVLAEAITSRKPHQVITANPIMIMMALDNPDYMHMMQQAEFIVPDGTGAVWAASHIGEPVAERVPGIELMHRLFEVGERHGWRAYLLGADPETIKEAYERLRVQYPLMKFVGYQDGYFSEERDAEVIAKIKAAEPDLLFVGRAANNQEPWIGRYKHELGVPVMMGVGGSFDVISGRLKRAPVVFQRLGLEWLHRLILQPTRWRRMLALPKFAWKVIRNRGQLRQDNLE